MTDMVEISLGGEMETLLVPLVSRADESRNANPIISDPEAARIAGRIRYDYTGLKIPQKTRLTLCIRARQFDRFTEAFIRDHPAGTVIHAGCGLDSRFSRLDNGSVRWYDLDYPEVIALRRNFFAETGRYHLIASSVTDHRWMEQVEYRDGPVLVVAEGLFMYLSDGEARSLVVGLQEAFPGCILVFDAFSAGAAERMAAHPSIQKTGAEVSWGIDDPEEVGRWHAGISLLDEWYFTRSEDIRKLGMAYRAAFRLADYIPSVRNAHRILKYRLG